MDQMTEESIIPEGFKRCECGYCNEIIPILNKHRDPARFKKGHNNKLERNYFWKNGKIKNHDGYVLVRMPLHPRAKNNNGYVFEHIIVMEQKLGRYLLPGEEIHHINGNKDDNRIENLQLFASHKQHLFIDMSNRHCCDCGTSETWRRRWFRAGNNNHRCIKCHRRFKQKINLGLSLKSLSH